MADNDTSSGDESFEMEVSETTRLVSSPGEGAVSPVRSPSKMSSSPRSTDGEGNRSFTNRAVDLDVDVNSINNLDADLSNQSDGESAKIIDDKQKTTPFVVLLAAFAAIGGFLFGYDTGVISGAMLLLRDEFSLTSLEQEMIVSVTIGAAFASALFGGFLSDRFGRKACTLFASFVFTAGAVVLAAAQNVPMLIAGRTTLGIGIGNESEYYLR